MLSDWEKYKKYLNGFDLSESEKEELIATIVGSVEILLKEKYTVGVGSNGKDN